MLEISWTHNYKNIFDTIDFFQKENKTNKVKLYNFIVIALALINREALQVGSLELNEQGFKLMGFGGNVGFTIFMILMFLILAIEPISIILKKYVNHGNILTKLGYKKKSNNTLAKDIVLYLLCLSLLAVPFLLF